MVYNNFDHRDATTLRSCSQYVFDSLSSLHDFSCRWQRNVVADPPLTRMSTAERAQHLRASIHGASPNVLIWVHKLLKIAIFVLSLDLIITGWTLPYYRASAKILSAFPAQWLSTNATVFRVIRAQSAVAFSANCPSRWVIIAVHITWNDLKFTDLAANNSITGHQVPRRTAAFDSVVHALRAPAIHKVLVAVDPSSVIRVVFRFRHSIIFILKQKHHWICAFWIDTVFDKSGGVFSHNLADFGWNFVFSNDRSRFNGTNKWSIIPLIVLVRKYWRYLLFFGFWWISLC